ncbi:MAG: hypothetical protein LUC31_02415 [Coprobacillus sp.]|nr:hypothetical protein [Coprobacillus sp.]
MKRIKFITLASVLLLCVTTLSSCNFGSLDDSDKKTSSGDSTYDVPVGDDPSSMGKPNTSKEELEESGNTGTVDHGDFTVSLSTLQSWYYPTDNINWDEVTLTLTFEDKSVVTLTHVEFDVDKATKEDTEAIIHTDGLYSASQQGLIPEGTYYLSYEFDYEEDHYESYALMVTVTLFPSEVYTVMEFEKPSLITTYEYNLTRVNSDLENGGENQFITSPSAYEVGDDNPFTLTPTLWLWNKKTQNIELPTYYHTSISVSYNGEELEASNQYASFSGFSVQFTSEAIDKEFEITLTLEGFDSDIVNNPIEPITFTVLVKDGYNVYDPIDLGRMSLVSGNTSVSNFENNRSGRNATFFAPDEYDSNGNVTQWHYEATQYHYFWEDFYESKGISGATNVNGIFLHDNITLTIYDVPEAFSISEEEAKANGVDNVSDMVGSLRDDTPIYDHCMEDDFTFNGNLFKLDCSILNWGMTDSDSSGFTYKTHTSNTWMEGSSVLFCVDGYRNDPNKPTCTIKNLEAVGNANPNAYAGKVDESGTPYTQEHLTEMDSQSIQFCKSLGAHTVIDNIICKEFRGAYQSEKTRSDEQALEISRVKTYDCYSTAIVLWCSANNSVSSSVFKRFGGCAIALTSATDYVTGYEYCGIDIASDVIIESEVSGTEPWFINTLSIEYTLSLGNLGDFNLDLDLSGIIVTMFKDFDSFLSGGYYGDYPCLDYGKTFLKNGESFNFIAAMLDRSILNPLYTSISYDGGSMSLDPTKEEDTGSYSYYARAFYNDTSVCRERGSSSGTTVPLFTTNTGKMFAPVLERSGSLLNYTYSEYLLDVKHYVDTGDKKAITDTGSALTSEDTTIYIYYEYNIVELIGSTLAQMASALGLEFFMGMGLVVSLYDENSDVVTRG